ncbi:hypothetical protein BV20DRAFT_1054651 [Pilatotrama ljubarskyi]|nr:hypothetical protein BV20DRAFT_1054651 [Pilatotrama ljubarskyi]
MISTQKQSVFAPLKVHFKRSKSAERRPLRSVSPQPQPQVKVTQSGPREEVDYAPQFGYQALGCKLLSLEDAQARLQRQQRRQPEVDWAPHYGFQALGCKLLSLEDAQRRHGMRSVTV